MVVGTKWEVMIKGTLALVLCFSHQTIIKDNLGI